MGNFFFFVRIYAHCRDVPWTDSEWFLGFYGKMYRESVLEIRVYTVPMEDGDVGVFGEIRVRLKSGFFGWIKIVGFYVKTNVVSFGDMKASNVASKKTCDRLNFLRIDAL